MEGLLVVRVHVSEDPDSLDSAGIEFTGRDLLDLEQAPESGAERLLLRRVVREAGDQPVGGEDGEAGILE